MIKKDNEGEFVKGCHPSTEFKKGYLSSKQGKTYEEIYGEERADKIKEKLSKSHQGINTKENHPRWKGEIPEMICEECGKTFKPKRHASKIQRCCSSKCKGEHFRGENHWSFMDGGESPYCYKFNFEFKERVREFFDRKCYLCGKTEEENGRRLDVHHVNWDKMVCCNDVKPLFVPLCMKHHQMLKADREGWEEFFTVSLEYLTDGKCFIPRTKGEERWQL